jgi:hypothetical protein
MPRGFDIYDNISLNSSYNVKWFRQNCRENQSSHFMLNKVFFRKFCQLRDSVENYSGDSGKHK